MYRWLCLTALLASVGCDEPAPSPANTGIVPAIEEAAKAPITKKAVEKEMAAAGDGPDCPTYLREVKQACADHYAKGLDVNCHTSITNVNTAIKQGKGELFKDPTGKDPDVAAKAGAKMCAMMGKRLREQVAKAATSTPPPKCVALGKKLEASCFARVGTADYPQQCSGIVMTTTKFNEQSDKICEMQMAMSAQLLGK